jgi:hypothetical protein
MATLTVDQYIEQYGVQAVVRAAVAACLATAKHVEGIVSVYPPATESNRPGRWTHPSEGEGQPRPMGYYERNRGWWYPVMNIERGSFGHYGKSAGRIKAPRNSAVAGYKLRATSEQMSKAWGVVSTPRGALLFNRASYSGYVHDALEQAALHAAHGWKTVQAALAQAIKENVTLDAFMQALG